MSAPEGQFLPGLRPLGACSAPGHVEIVWVPACPPEICNWHWVRGNWLSHLFHFPHSFLDGNEDRLSVFQLRARVSHAHAHPGCARPDCTTAAQLPCASGRLCPLLTDLLSGIQGRKPSCQSSAAAAAIGLKKNKQTKTKKTKKQPKKTKGKDDM